ncbi:hypothetical protein [Parasutterella excrementihominis]
MSLISVRILCKLTSAIIIMRYIVMEKTRICLLRVYFLTGTELKA